MAHALELWTQGRRLEAEQALRRHVLQAPDDAEGLRGLAGMLSASGRASEALELWTRVTTLQPSDGPAWRQRGQLLMSLQRLPEAVEVLDRAVSLEPRNCRGHHNLGLALLRLGNATAAVTHLERALQLEPGYALAHMNLGVALQALTELAGARQHFERALALDPHLTHARLYLVELLRREDAAAAAAEECRAHESLAVNLMTARRYAEAAAVWGRLLERDPAFPYARGMRFHCRLHDCDWRDYADESAALRASLATDAPGDTPFNVMVYSASAADGQHAARGFTRQRHPPCADAVAEPAAAPRLRIAYLSSEFRAHATAYLIAELLERHDRSRFEVRAIAYGEDDHSAMRHRIGSAVEHFVDVQGMSDEAVVQQLRDWGAHIVIDLKGHTGGARTGILARRAAPVQVNFLGFPGGMGAPYIDYIVADRRVIPAALESCYDEQCLLLPDCYQPNDRQRPLPADAPPRSECGLPAHGLVFGCFNHLYKVTPAVFSLWMGLLQAQPDAVLWLLESTPAGAANLRRAAVAAGVDPGRVVFAPHRPQAAHLARYRHMALFLDTFPCNAHTTASDALWMGVPVVTCIGESFASRVATSLLHACGLPALSTNCLEDYAALARRLAASPPELRALRETLDAQRLSAPLFDVERYCRSLEGLYEQVAGRDRRAAGMVTGRTA